MTLETLSLFILGSVASYYGAIQVVFISLLLIYAISRRQTKCAPAVELEGFRGKAPYFSDPTVSKKPFDPRFWKLFRIFDGDLKWREMDTMQFPKCEKFDRNTNVNSGDFVLRGGLPSYHPEPIKDKFSLKESSIRGAEFYAYVSQGTGCVPSDYGGPLFLLPGLIIAAYVCGEQARERLLNESNRKAMAAYLLNHQQEDGGWGTHIAGTSTNFGTILNYVALRLIGVRATHERCCKARIFLATREGALGAPLWAKMWLAVLGCYEYRGISPVPPEMWLLPDWFPFHPGKTWCHARVVALALSYLYGKRFVYPEAERDSTITQLRVELYPVGGPYHAVNWSKASKMLYSGELYGAEPRFLLKFGNLVLEWLLESTWLGSENSFLRSRALECARRHLKDEDETNAYLCIGPVNKALNMVCAFAAGESKAVIRHIETMDPYIWVAEDGMKMQGYINSMVWDSSFALLSVATILQAEDETERQNNKRLKALMKFSAELNDFLARNQLDRDPSSTQNYRDASKGGWGFSTKENTYTVSDCTAEALRAILSYCKLSGETPKADVNAAVDLILWMQNPDDNAWASYEKRRGYRWYELLNPAAIFGDIMIDYSYVECTSSCIQALASFIQYVDDCSVENQSSRVLKCKEAIKLATTYLFKQQRSDGSWFGQWGVCFTYATLFAVEALCAARDISCVNVKQSTDALTGAALFLAQMQNEDGGWGESVDACALKQWVPDPEGSNVVNTAWATLTLARILSAKTVLNKGLEIEIYTKAKKGAEWLRQSQTETGDWAQQSSISGVFNKTCGITYTSYKNIFPVWALAEISRLEIPM